MNIQEFAKQFTQKSAEQEQQRKQRIRKAVVKHLISTREITKDTEVVFMPSSKVVPTPVPKRRENSDFQKDTRFRFIDPTVIEDKEIMLKYLDWIARPRHERKPQLQKEFAENHGIHYNTLTAWKQLTGFWDEVKIRRDVIFRKYSSDIFYALVKRARTGAPREVELFAKMFEQYSDKFEVENTNPVQEIPLEQRQLINTALKNIGLAAVLEANNPEEVEGETQTETSAGEDA